MEAGLGVLKKSIPGRPARDKAEPASFHNEPSSPSSSAIPATPTLRSSLIDDPSASDIDEWEQIRITDDPEAANPGNWTRSPSTRTESLKATARSSTPPLTSRINSRVSRGSTATTKDADCTRSLPPTAPSAPLSSSPGNTSIDPLSQVFSFMAGAGGGFIPHHKEPPRYIRVKAHDKKTREFDRMFLAQELIGTRPLEQPAGTKMPQVTISTSSQARRRATTGGAVWTTEFSKDGKYMAAGGRGHVVRVWAVIATAEDRRTEEDAEIESGSLGERLSAPVFLEKPIREFEGHTGDILDLSWSKNNFLLSTAMDKTVRLWHISRHECLCTFKHKELVSKVAFHPKDDRFFLAGCLDAVLRLWSIPDKSIAFSTRLPDMITAVAFSPDGKVSMAGLLNGYCHFFDTEGLRSQSQMHVRSSRGRNAKGSKITGIVSIVPPGSRDTDAKILITSTDSRVRVYNLRDKTLDGKFKGHEHATTQLCASFSDDGKYVICGSEDSKAFVWSDDATRSVAVPKPRPEETPGYIARSTHYDGNIIVTSDETGIIKVFRQDCAANKRKHESWETGSSFSRKLTASGLVGRNGSIITRNSMSSVARSRRGSLTQPQLSVNVISPPGAAGCTNQSGNSDRIISWRQDIESNDSRTTPLTATPTRSERSISPTKVTHTPMGAPGGLASEARKQPYAGTSLPRTAQSTALVTKENSTSPSTRSLASLKLADQKPFASTSTLSEGATVTETKMQPKDPNSLPPASRSGWLEQKENRDDKGGAQPEADNRSFGPPAPSFSFRPSDNDDPLRLDPAGASYSFWNLNKWKGIANLRASITGNTGSGGDSGGHHHHHSGGDKSGDGFGNTTVMPKSPLAKSFTPTDGDSSTHAETTRETRTNRAEGLTPLSEKQLRRRSAASGSGQEHLTPATTRASATETNSDQSNSFLHLPKHERGPYTRDNSIVSKLSSELTSSDSDADDQSDSAEGTEMRCAKCGGREFKARRIGGRQLLHCSRCGKAADDGEDSREDADAGAARIVSG
ncbi:WD repeat protein [Grosmannia clavigera kw1407]|uniref:WD repeat protein n=1 Tax=Grosmannia clavigera (strain kw1407 / UAMH 11150) TaxID=655863 RepID=F0X8N4_GROCL|nr:WD repeat protein [Grosmannia clavigera kw1407]EFX05336.1 WD repeat protein [Grosmannia clavigera kw1407]